MNPRILFFLRPDCETLRDVRPTSGPPLRNSALMLATASTETAHEGESNQVRIIRKTLNLEEFLDR